MNTQELVSLVKTVHGLRTDYAAHQFLGVSRQTVRNWTLGRNTLDDDTAVLLADALDLPASLVLAWVHLERAKSPPVVAAWRAVVAAVERRQDAEKRRLFRVRSAS